MSNELLQTALRVLSCYAALGPQWPEPEDVAQLRSAAESDTRTMPPEMLAIETIQREIIRRRAGSAAE